MHEKPILRVSTLLIEDDKILCVDYQSVRGERFYVFPGGALDPGETLREGAIREVREEAGFDCEIIKLVYFQDLLLDRKENYHILDYFFLGKRTSEIKYEVTTDNGKNLALVWVPLSEFSKIKFLPANIKTHLVEDYNNDFPMVRFFENVHE